MRDKGRRIGVVVAALALLVVAGCVDQGGNQKPTAEISYGPQEGVAPLVVRFDASGSGDPDGQIVAYEWDFGDGETGSGVTVEHTYADDGVYRVRLMVTDDAGATDVATVQVEVRNPPPTASFTYSPQAPVVGEPVRFDAGDSTDPASLSTKEVVSYHWDFGDGNEGSGVVVEHIYLEPGEYRVVLTVTDDDGDSATAEAQVTVAPPEPPPPPGG